MIRRRKGTWALWKAVPRLFPYFRPYRRLALISVVLTALTVLVGLAHPWPLAFMVDSVLGKHPPPGLITHLLGTSNRYAFLVFAALAGLVLTIITNGVSVVHEYVNTKLEARVVLDFRSDLFSHAQRLSIDYHDRKQTGQLMSQMLQEAEAAGSFMMSLLPLAQSAVTLIGMFLIALRIDSELALLSLAVVPFIYYAVGLYTSRIVPVLVYVRGLEWQSASIIFESMAMLRVVAAFAREPYEFGRFRKQGNTAAEARVGLTVRQTLFSLGVNTLTAAGTALILGVGAFHVLHGRLTTGELLVVLFYIAAVYQPLETISSSFGTMQQQLVAVQGAFQILDAEPEIDDPAHAVPIERAQGAVEFEHVHFSYQEREETLKDITFAVEAGQHVALVGPTGAGKTTLINLIMRFYDPKEGRVKLDGIDVRELTVRSLREQISIVLQVPQLFSGTIADNIRYGKLDASLDEIVEAARAANAHDFIDRLPARYDNELGEGGAQLSVGERQRICVARAFLKDAPILILDEPTSAIDSMTESVILDALDRLMVGRTTFVIAHRLSTVRHADQILVMDGGCIVQRGGHDELLKLGGLYRQLHEAQQGSHRAAARVAAVGGLTPTPLARTNGSGRNPQDGRVGEAELKAELERMLARSVNGNASPASLPTAAALLLRAAAEDLRENGNWAALRSLTRLRPSPLEELRIAAELAHTLLYELGLAAEPPGAGAVGAEGRAEIVRRLAPALRHASEEVLL